MKKVILILVVSLAILGCAKNSPAPSNVSQSQTTTVAVDTTIKVWCFYKGEAPNLGVLLYCAKSKAAMQAKAQEYRDAEIFVDIVGKQDCIDC